MEQRFEPINSPHTIGITINPADADLAILYFDGSAEDDRFNSFVVRLYGYSMEDYFATLEQTDYHFATLTGSGQKPIILVSDNGIRDTTANLFDALSEFRGWFRDKKLWMPFGHGTDTRPLETRYRSLVETINRFQKEYPTNVNLLISIQDSEEGIAFHNKLEQLKEPESDENPELKETPGENNPSGSKYYYVNNVVNHKNLTGKFIRESYWEGSPIFSETILKLQPRDVLFLYEVEPEEAVYIQRIKAIGIVTRNSSDGTTVGVNWIITGLILYFPGFNGSISIIAVNPRDIEDILKQLNDKQSETFQNALNSSTEYNDKDTYAILTADSDRGIDHLEIARDVNAFARVITAKSFEPPLAIALFGKWGSGKSFFMQKLKDRVTSLSADNRTTETYCQGVAQIHFNAWSYMDSNLWASIVTKIFEELSEYISENRKADVAKKDIEKQLSSQLSITKEEISILENKRDAVQEQITSLEGKRDTLNDELKTNIDKVKEDTLWSFIEQADKEFEAEEKIKAALSENKTYIKSEEELKKIIPEKYWGDPDKTYELAKSRITFLKGFFRKEDALKNLLWLAGILLVIIIVPIVLEVVVVKLKGTNFLIPQATLTVLATGGLIWKRGEAVYNKLQPLVSAFWKVKSQHEEKIKEATSNFEQQEKALKLEIEKGKAEVLLISEQIQKEEAIKADLEFRINNALATETLYSFIDRRSKSDDYKKHLGIISIIRRDFEILNDLFIDHKEEANKIKDADDFRKKFKKPLERIVLYIDDLDRCPEENVVQVLEAVNLLMAFPLFVVIVGVDSRWVRNALIKKHALQFAGITNGMGAANPTIELIEPSNYLEKIFQIPFHLKDAKDTSIKGMIKKLAEVAVETENQTTAARTQAEDVQTTGDQPAAPIVFAGTTETTLVATPNQTIAAENPKPLVLTENEVALMQDMSEVIGNNPRAIKRFVNIYRIIKAHEEFSYPPSDNNPDLIAILFLLALSLGKYQKLTPSLEAYMQDDKNSTKQFTLYLQSGYKVDGFDELKHKLNVALSNKESFGILQRTPIQTLKDHNGFTSRFTFMQI